MKINCFFCDSFPFLEIDRVQFSFPSTIVVVAQTNDSTDWISLSLCDRSF